MEKRKILAGIAFGAAVGSALGALYAPEKGSKTRKKLSKKGAAYAEELKARFDHLIDGFIEQMNPVEEEDDTEEPAETKTAANGASQTPKASMNKPVKRAAPKTTPKKT